MKKWKLSLLIITLFIVSILFLFTLLSLVEKTRESAKQILQKDPQLKKYPALQDRLSKFRERIHLE